MNASNFTSENIEAFILSSIFGLLDLFLIGSNLFIIITLSHGFRGRSTATRKLLINLAVADLCLGVLVLIPAIGTELFHIRSSIGTFDLCQLCLGLDVFFSTASIYSLTVISVDRFLAVCFALRYNHLMSGYRVLVALLIPWTMSILFSLPIVVLFKSRLIMPSGDMSYYPFCTIRNSGTILRMYQIILCWCIPTCILVYSYSRVCMRVIENIRGQSTGVIEDKGELTRLKKSTTNQGDQKCPEKPISSLRVHIGGQPCYMKVNGGKQGKGDSKMFSYIPGTVKCGFLIVAATLPQKMNENQLIRVEKDENDENAVGQQDAGTKNIGRHRSSTSLNIFSSSGTQLDVYHAGGGASLSARNSDDSQSSRFLKPSTWIYGKNKTRKSDSEFANIRSFRRCALMPIQPRVNRSVSGEILGTFPSGNTTEAPRIQSPEPPSNTPSFTCEPEQNQTNKRLKRECKAIMQMLLNCLTLFLGWLPFFSIQLIEIWTPSEWINYRLFAATFWVRFFLTAFNPFVVGYASEELRKAFRSLIYCGHPKQEKKALKRLVLAGLGAAGIPYGRPIVPMRSHPLGGLSSTANVI